MSTAPGRSRPWLQLLVSLAAVGLGVALLAELPVLVGVSWASIGANLAQVPVLVLVSLCALWFVGLLVHAPVLMAAMPGLNARQALTLNMSGSAVSNLLPLGGPAGMGLGYAMARSWGFRAEAYASYTVSTNLWNMIGRFITGLSILGTAALLGNRLPGGLGPVLLGAGAFMLIAVGSTVTALRRPETTAAVGRRLDSLLRRFRPDRAGAPCTTWLLGSRAELLRSVRAGWKKMTIGVLAYLILQAALLWACLAASGAAAPVGVVAIAFAVERLISLAPITPGAAGVAEVGTVAALHALGIEPVSAAAGVLLYRIFMFAIDIPIGGVLALRWMHLKNSSASIARGDLAPEAVAVKELANA
jgi:uncharacterized membrane protein YbhN (UPF0104 family)